MLGTDDFNHSIIEHALNEVEGILGAAGLIHREFNLNRSGQAGDVGGFVQLLPDEAGNIVEIKMATRDDMHQQDFALDLNPYVVGMLSDQ